MSKSLPLKDTSVKSSKSIIEIIEDLKAAGFDSIGQGSQESNYYLHGKYNGKSFLWVVNSKSVKNVLIENSTNKIKKLLNKKTQEALQARRSIENQAERTAWRVLADKIHADCITVRYGLDNIDSVFGGYVALPDPSTGQITTVGKLITVMAENGKLNSTNIMAPLMLPENLEVK